MNSNDYTTLTHENSGSIILKKVRMDARENIYEKKEVVAGYHNRYFFIGGCGHLILLVYNTEQCAYGTAEQELCGGFSSADHDTN
jgi:hypothetical protein